MTIPPLMEWDGQTSTWNKYFDNRRAFNDTTVITATTGSHTELD